MDFNALQHKLFAMDPVDPREDLAKLRGQANGSAADVAPTKNYVAESVEVPEGSLKLDKDYSVSDFAALAGVVPQTITEGPMDAIKQGWNNYNSVDALKGDPEADSTPSTSKSAPSAKSTAAKPSAAQEPKATSSTNMHPKLVSKLEPYADQLETIFRSSKLRVKFEKFLNLNAPRQESIEEPVQAPEKESIKDLLYKALAEFEKKNETGKS